jgi:hypothetical protein
VARVTQNTSRAFVQFFSATFGANAFSSQNHYSAKQIAISNNQNGNCRSVFVCLQSRFMFKTAWNRRNGYLVLSKYSNSAPF